MTDPLDYWQRRESNTQRVYGLSGPDGVAIDTQRRPSRQVPPRAEAAPRHGTGSRPGEDAADGAGQTAAGEGADPAERGQRAEGDEGEANDLEADIAVERDTLETVDPENPPG